MSTVRSDGSGFTIVELLISIGIGAIFIIAVSNLTISNNSISNRSRDVAVVNSFVENKVESLRSAGFLNLADGTTNIASELPNELKTPRSASVVISPQTASVKKVVVSVTYNNQGSAKTYGYTTYIGELGVGQY